MRYFGITAIAASALMLGACGGGEKKAADTAAAAPAESAATGAAPATNAPAAGAVAAAPITGTTHEVKLMVDASGKYRFDPETITIKAGDGIKYINASGGPHNVAFNPTQLPADVKGQLDANMPPEKLGELASHMLTTPNESYTISFGNIKPGTYEAYCQPHLAMGMKQTITVQ